MTNTVLTNATIVLPDEVVHGTVTLKNGQIEDVSETLSSVPSAFDCEKQYLIPGLVELHTDNLEKHFVPRPKVTWPGQPAVIAHDSQLIASGITTVFDAIALGDVNENSQRLENLQLMIDALKQASTDGLFRAEHMLHLRCEVCHEDVLNLFEDLIETPEVHLVSLMDHSPGQRQFTNMDKYRTYYQGKYHFNSDELERFIEKQKGNSLQYSDKHRRGIVDICNKLNIPMASHDDATQAHVEESARMGMRIAEFPTTEVAASLSHEKGMAVMMGAPNVVRGGSHSGNIAAHELARIGVLDILSSDYCPASILHAAFVLKNLENDHDISSAINTVSRNPAKAAKLNDRGEISIGKRADLVLVKEVNDFPLVSHVWSQGVRCF
uniref:COG3454 Metal-dependent hydrolase involved in phosphonate metabolism n=1 Tax=uncultured bacterium B3TF_MPn1 TaxID=1439866 RepID=W0NUP2_9BACT|nr:COG3454 Metal-dependent hydrolase involved in phosphonate metabolism [uncultured bacterium B3TF_MPn1]